jgi:hypothetical protein
MIYEDFIGKPIKIVLKTKNQFDKPFIFNGILTNCDSFMIEINDVKEGIKQFSRSIIDNSEPLEKTEWNLIQNKMYGRPSIKTMLRSFDKNADEYIKKDFKQGVTDLKKLDDKLVGKKNV